MPKGFVNAKTLDKTETDESVQVKDLDEFILPYLHSHCSGISKYIFLLDYKTFRVGGTRLLSSSFSLVQFSCSVMSDSLQPMNRSMPGLPVYHQLLEFTQTHVRQVSDAIQPSHPLSSPSPPAPNPSQHQGLFQ